MSVNGKSLFLNVISENPVVARYVQLIRMPLFLTVLDEEFSKLDGADWETESGIRETVFRIMPDTLSQFGVPAAEADKVIEQCLAELAKKKTGE